MASIKFENPSCYFVSGSTSSGKSRLIARLIRNKNDMFKNPPVEVYYAYKEWQPALYGGMQENDGVKFFEGVPTEEIIKKWSREVGGKHILLVLDDLQHDVCSSKDMAVLFSVTSHHCNVSCILVAQRLFPQSKFSRDLCLNCHYIFLLSSKRDKLQVANMGRQLCPGQSAYFTSAYDDCMAAKPYNYLLVDLHPSSPRQYLLRTDIFPDELTVVYLPK
jgi:hypothetical protein